MTLIEIMIVVVILVTLVTLSLITMGNVREQSRDTQRVSDITQLQVALSAYYRDTGAYPLLITGGQQIKASNTVYMAKVPVPPTPQDGAVCIASPVYASYYYVPAANLKSYNLYFCLGDKTSDVLSGANKATPGGIVASTTP